MNPLKKLKAFRQHKPAPAQDQTFVWEGVSYATPSVHTEAISGFDTSSRGRAWAAYQSSLHKA